MSKKTSDFFFRNKIIVELKAQNAAQNNLFLSAIDNLKS
jgi:hypothetical protein